jgi:hypothetical protein
VGNALLLWWSVLVGVVLRVSLCPADIGCVPIKGTPLHSRSHPRKDFVGVDKMSFCFELGKPFRPFEQLMAVLPEASKELVPLPYRVSAVYVSHKDGI